MSSRLYINGTWKTKRIKGKVVRLKYGRLSPRRIFYDKGFFLLVCLVITLLAGIIFFCTYRISYADVREGNASGFGRMIHFLKGEHHSKTRSGDGDIPEYRFEYFKDFIVHVPYDNKEGRILLCDVVLELHTGTDLPCARVELRKVIYETSKTLCTDLPGLPRTKKKMRRLIKINLNNFMGGDIIKSVHFTKFVLL